MLISRRHLMFAAPLALAARGEAKTKPPSPYGALPSPRQLRWHQLETYAFLHFTVNTFTDKEWGYGDEDPKIFNPTDFDADAIISALKAGGMKGVILTCKHHDGFCLWPTKTTDHCVRQSNWRDGKGDVVREISEAARRQGLLFGVYVSPWDRNNANYGRPEYVETYRTQLRELLTQYGPIFEVWHDGANGGDGYYGGAREKRTIDKHSYYGWPQTWDMIRTLQPEAVIFSDAGPDIRWVGNERGYAAETCWETFDPVGEKGGLAAPGDVRSSESVKGTRHGSRWMPPECDVSIRPGWFWHEKDNARVKTPSELMDLYFRSTGRGASLLLNVPPDRRGRLHENDVASLAAFGNRMAATFRENRAASASTKASHVRGRSRQFAAANLIDGKPGTYWCTDDHITTADITFEWRQPVTFDVIRLREYIPLGQRIDRVAVDIWQQDQWQEVGDATSIGACRLLQLSAKHTTDRARLRVIEASAAPALSEFSLYLHA